MNKGLTANVCDENGHTALEYALKYDTQILKMFVQNPKTTKETLGKGLDYIEAELYFNKDIAAFRKWEKERPLALKIFDIICFSPVIDLSTKAANATRSLAHKHLYLYEAYQKMHE